MAAQTSTHGTESTTDISETQQNEFAVTDTVLLDNMVLASDVVHPVTGVVLLTKGGMLTKKMVSQLSNLGITSVQATPYAAECVAKAVEQVQGYLNSVEKIISVKGQSVKNAALFFQEMQEVKALQQMMQEQMQQVMLHFNERAADSLIQLNNHHPNSAHHSIITGFNAMAIARELRWEEADILEVTMASMTHDVGKAKVPLSTLEWPNKLNDAQWQEMHLHTLFGGKLLHQGSLNSATMVALNHHEWYADVGDKGYGSLTLFREVAKEALDLDVDLYLAHSTPRALEMIQVTAIADMVAALEEIRSYKGALPPFKVLIIMNNDAKQGHFNPELYQAWHTLYLRKHRRLLTKGMRLALPREKEQHLERNGKPFIALDAVVKKLSYEELVKSELLHRLKASYFDLEALQKSDGISIDRMQRRGIEISDSRLAKLGITPEKTVKILLPAMEKRLNQADLLRLGVPAKKLADRRLAKLLEQSKNGLSLPDLAKLGIQLPKEALAADGEALDKKIFYDLLVVEEISYCRALFAIVREGNVLEELEKSDVYEELDPLQSYLLNKIGLVELDFTELITDLPDMSSIVRGAYWEPQNGEAVYP